MNFGDTLEYLIGEYQHYENKVEEVINQSKSAINSKITVKRTVDKPPETVDAVIEKGRLYLQDLDKDSEERIKEALALTAANAKETNASNDELRKILEKMDLGVLAESQRKMPSALHRPKFC